MVTFSHFLNRLRMGIRQNWEVLSAIAIGLGIFLFFILSGNFKQGPNLRKTLKSINEKHLRERESLDRIHEEEITSIEDAVSDASETIQKLDEDHERALSSLESRKAEAVSELEIVDPDVITERLRKLTEGRGD